MTEEQRAYLESIADEYYRPDDPFRRFMLEAQIPSVNRDSKILYSPGRDLATIGDCLVDAAAQLLYKDLEEGRISKEDKKSLDYMIVRLATFVNAKGLTATGWKEAWEAASEEFPVSPEMEEKVFALLGRLTLSGIWHAKRTANKANDDGSSFFCLTDCGELLSETCRRFLDESFAPVLDDLDNARRDFYSAVNKSMRERRKRTEVQARQLSGE